MNMRTGIIFSLLMIFGVGISHAQWFYSFSFDHEYSTNPFRVPEGNSDQVSQFMISIGREWEQVVARYDADFIRFQQNSSRNYYWHQFVLSGGDSTIWYIQMENRLDRSDYRDYDYFNLAAGLNHQFMVRGNYWRMGANFYLNTYREMSDLDNFQFNGFFSMTHSFPTRTTFIGTLHLNYKSYLTPYPTEVVPDDASEQFAEMQQGMGRGRGGWGYVPHSMETASVSQVVMGLRLAQSIAPHTGVVFQYTGRFALSNADRTVAGFIPGYSDESMMFDDPMGYQGHTFGIEINQILPYFFYLKLAGYRQWKDYLSQGIYLNEDDYDEGTLRCDDYRTIWVSLRKNWALSDSLRLVWNVNYRWVDNRSNSYWYQYTNQSLETGIGIEF